MIRLSRAAALSALLALLPAAWPAAQEPSRTFSEFLAEIRADAVARGISAKTLDETLANLEPEPVVVARDRSQPEQVQSLERYVSRRVTAPTVRRARTLLSTHRRVLADVERQYGVPPHVVMATWAVESNFGQFTGTYSVVRSLATLAYDARRPIFRDELMSALTIIDRGMVTSARLKGSWAGAMGQPQFMPSSFLEKAVDFDKNGAIDIWTSLPDVFGSMGHYLQQAGWVRGERWGREVTLSSAALARVERDVPMRASGCRAIRELTDLRPLKTWSDLGVTIAHGRPLPQADLAASLIRGEARYFLAYKGYEAFLAYNCSNSYAVAVGMLADAIAGG